LLFSNRKNPQHFTQQKYNTFSEKNEDFDERIKIFDERIKVFDERKKRWPSASHSGFKNLKIQRFKIQRFNDLVQRKSKRARMQGCQGAGIVCQILFIVYYQRLRCFFDRMMFSAPVTERGDAAYSSVEDRKPNESIAYGIAHPLFFLAKRPS